MTKKELIKLLELHSDDTEIALLNDEFCEYFTPKNIKFIELGTFEDLAYRKTSDFPKYSIREMYYVDFIEDYKLISSKKYIYID
jgi:hypothetical protein